MTDPRTRTGTGHNNSITYNKHKIEISQDNSNHSKEKFGFILNITMAIYLIFLIENIFVN